MFTLPLSRRSPWTPFRDLERILDDMNRTFSLLRDDSDAVSDLPVNIWSTSDGLVVQAEVPGIAPEAVSVSVLDNTLTIHGTCGEQRSITRTLQLPYRVDADQTEARCQDGILTVVLRRPEAEKPRRIEIKAA